MYAMYAHHKQIDIKQHKYVMSCAIDKNEPNKMRNTIEMIDVPLLLLLFGFLSVYNDVK
jgi:hypothetical protein